MRWPCYVVPVYDVGDNNMNVPFVLNVTFAGIVAVQVWDSRQHNSQDFWVAYLLQSFQMNTWQDMDPNSELSSSVLGVTSGSDGGALIFLEIHQAHEGISDPLGAEQDTVVHEIGHAVGNGDDEPVSTNSVYEANYLNLIRSSIKPSS